MARITKLKTLTLKYRSAECIGKLGLHEMSLLPTPFLSDISKPVINDIKIPSGQILAEPKAIHMTQFTANEHIYAWSWNITYWSPNE